MAQRSREDAGSAMCCWCEFLGMGFPRLGYQPEKRESIPAGASDLDRDVAQGSILPVLTLKAVLQNFDQDGLPFPLPAKHSAHYRHARIMLAPAPKIRNSLHSFTADREEIPWRDDAKIRIVGDLARAPTSAFGEISFRKRL